VYFFFQKVLLDDNCCYKENAGDLLKGKTVNKEAEQIGMSQNG